MSAHDLKRIFLSLYIEWTVYDLQSKVSIHWSLIKSDNMAKPRNNSDIEVVDLFCGIGGLSCGLKSKGFKVLAGYDIDGTCQYAYEHNNTGYFVHKDMRIFTMVFLKQMLT